MESLRIVLIGCTLSAKRCLEALIENPACELSGIITLHVSRAASKARYTDLASFASQREIPLLAVQNIEDPAVLGFLRTTHPDLLLEVGWSQRIPKEILSFPRLGCIGIHNSLLPKNQGAASLNWALIRGEQEWGTTLFYLAEQIDAGDIIAQQSYPVTEEDDINTLFAKADEAAIALLRDALPGIATGTAPRIPQDQAEITRLPRRRSEDGKVSWAESSRTITRLIRALKKPYPPAYTFLRGAKVFLCDAHSVPNTSKGPGIVQEISREGMLVGAADTSLLLLMLEREGDHERSAGDFARTYDLHPGDRFDG